MDLTQIKHAVPTLAVPYFDVRDELSEEDGTVFRGNRAVIPASLRHYILERIHSGHIGVGACVR